nr:MAG TPA: hypothetical protein [Caudoviricetes sp.]
MRDTRERPCETRRRDCAGHPGKTGERRKR